MYESNYTPVVETNPDQNGSDSAARVPIRRADDLTELLATLAKQEGGRIEDAERMAQLIQYAMQGGPVLALRQRNAASDKWRTLWVNLDDESDDRVEGVRVGETGEWYFCTVPLSEVPPSNSKGESQKPQFVAPQKKYVTALNLLFADFDAHDLNTAKDSLLAHIDGLPHAPSVIIDSGGGYHCYWLLNETIELDTDEMRNRYSRLITAWLKYVGEAADTSAAGLGRVLRIAGTQNHKEAQPRPVTFVKFDMDVRYTLEELTGDMLDQIATSADGEAVPAPGAEGLSVEAALALMEQSTNRFHSDPDGPTVQDLLVGNVSELANDASSIDWRIMYTAAYYLGRKPELVVELFKKTRWYDPGTRVEKHPDYEGYIRHTAREACAACQSIHWMWRGIPDLTRYGTDHGGHADAVSVVAAGRFCYSPAWGWLEYDGTHWTGGAIDNDGRGLAMYSLQTLIGEVLSIRALQFYTQAGTATLTGSSDEAKKNEKKARACTRDAGRLRGVEQFLQSALVVPDTRFTDRPEYLLNVANGTVDLRTGELREHRRTDYFSYCIGVEYDPNAKSELWERLLREWVGTDEMVSYLHHAAGYSVTGSTRLECMFYLQGTPQGRDGKGTFLNTISELVGNPLAVATMFETFTNSKEDSSGFKLAPLHSARMVIASESRPTYRMNEQLVKLVTGTDHISCAFKHKQVFTYKPRFKIWLMSNHPIRGASDDEAFWRRFRIIPFPNSRSDDEVDFTLKDRLREPAEQRAILAWLIEGAGLWYANGLADPIVVKQEREKQRTANDYVLQWLSEVAFVIPEDDRNPDSRSHWTSGDDLYQSFKDWTQESGIRYQVARQEFTKRLTAAGFETKQIQDKGKRVRVTLGILLTPYLTGNTADPKSKSKSKSKSKPKPVPAPAPALDPVPVSMNGGIKVNFKGIELY